MAITSAIKNHGGVPTLFVNDQPQPGLAYITYLTERADYQGMTELGCNLFSVCVYFASRPVNVAEQCGPFAEGVFENQDKPDFSLIDREVQRVLDACSHAYIFPRINMNLPTWWDEQHPEELNDAGAKGHAARPCVASQVWRDAVAERLCQVIRHMEASPWADHIIGYQIAGGQTEEWMAIDMNGCRGKRLREAFEKACPNGTETDYRVYSSLSNVEAIEFFAQTAKKLLKGQKVIGAFYGYTFETPWWQQAHGALRELLAGTGVDFLCSPLTYYHMRASGIDWASMTVQDTVQKHGRLYFAEADIRTCNTLPLSESRPGICLPEHYSGGLWAGPEDPWECCQQLRCAFGRMLTHGNALWWFDMWGGWYDRPEFRREMSSFFELAQRSLADTQRGSIAELAVFVDEKACAQTEKTDPTATIVAKENRLPLGSCGTPYDVFDISDFADILEEKDTEGKPRYKAAVFLIPHATEAMTQAIALWERSGRSYLRADQLAPLLDAKEVYDLCCKAGIHCWAQPGDVLYANANWLVLHAATEGEKTLMLPRKAKVREVCADGETCEVVTDRLTVQLRQYETKLYRVEPV